MEVRFFSNFIVSGCVVGSNRHEHVISVTMNGITNFERVREVVLRVLHGLPHPLIKDRIQLM